MKKILNERFLYNFYTNEKHYHAVGQNDEEYIQKILNGVEMFGLFLKVLKI